MQEGWEGIEVVPENKRFNFENLQSFINNPADLAGQIV